MTEPNSIPGDPGRERFSLVAEALATLAVGFVATMGACLVFPLNQDHEPWERLTAGGFCRALALGMTAGAVALGMLGKSPGLANPIVPVALFAIGRLRARWLVALVTAQLLGALGGAALARGMFPSDVLFRCRGGAPLWAQHAGPAQVLAGEFTVSFILLWILLGVNAGEAGSRLAPWNQPARTAAAIGLMMTVAGLVLYPVTGGSINPAIALGAAVTGGFWEGQVYYWSGALAGALTGAVTFHFAERGK